MCHRDLFRSYQEVGMARSFYRPRPETAIEDFAHAEVVHAPSRQRFAMQRSSEGRFLFRRWQLDPEGQPINVLEQEVDWVLGSGNHARTYLYQTPQGELFQLPVAWYTQEAAWGMAPGYDRPDHEGVLRRVRRECMFCHNAYPEAPAGSDAYEAPHVFPRALPDGTGCQRCHGPGAEHIRVALSGTDDAAKVRAAIVNPARLPPARRDDVCFECHLQPAVALPGVLRFGRGDFSFRPGEALADFRVQVDVEEEGRTPAERFEINHHPYRLRQSRCWLASQGALNCLTCHDPHRKVPAVERAAHYRAACLTCHAAEACTRETHGGAAAQPDDCAGCHMPKRRTQDVVHVVMTDHLIRRRPGGPELLAPLAESEPVLTDVHFLEPASAPAGDLGEVYRAVTLLRASGSRAVLDHLAKKLPATGAAAVEPWLDLARGQLQQHRFTDAEGTLRAVLARPQPPLVAEEWLAFAQAGLGRRAEAIATLRRVLARDPDRPEARFNLGHFLLNEGKAEQATAELRRAIELRPNQVPAWLDLGAAQARLGRLDEAAASFRRALEIEPSQTEAYLSLARILDRAGRRPEALRYLRHGAAAAAHPERLTAALADF
jgi:Tfp pilus assembly protein PilF